MLRANRTPVLQGGGYVSKLVLTAITIGSMAVASVVLIWAYDIHLDNNALFAAGVVVGVVLLIRFYQLVQDSLESKNKRQNDPLIENFEIVKQKWFETFGERLEKIPVHMEVARIGSDKEGGVYAYLARVMGGSDMYGQLLLMWTDERGNLLNIKTDVNVDDKENLFYDYKILPESYSQYCGKGEDRPEKSEGSPGQEHDDFDDFYGEGDKDD